MAIERQSPSAAHWSEREYHALFPDPADEAGAPRRICLVVETVSAVAGFVVALPRSGMEIENIIVDQALLRRGCATLLLRELLSRAAGEGGCRVLLEVRESNAAARAFYARWGFQTTGRRRKYYRDPEEDAVLLHFTCNSLSP